MDFQGDGSILVGVEDIPVSSENFEAVSPIPIGVVGQRKDKSWVDSFLCFNICLDFNSEFMQNDVCLYLYTWFPQCFLLVFSHCLVHLYQWLTVISKKRKEYVLSKVHP